MKKTIIFILLAILVLGCDREPEKVLIIGDSISIGYTPHVQEALSGKYTVVHNEGNAGHTGMGLENIHDWLGEEKWDIILFNWGLWDLCYRHPDSKLYGNRDKINGTLTFSPEEYGQNLDSLARILKRTGARLSFVTTTCVPEYEGGRIQGDEYVYNSVARAIMFEHGIQVTDLNKYSYGIHAESGKGDDDVHYTVEGYKELSEVIVSAITGKRVKTVQQDVDPGSIRFSFKVYDAVTIRGDDNPTTQVAVTLDRWPGNTFTVWLPEAVGDLWQQWDAEVAHQDFATTEKDGLIWIYKGHSAGFIRTELVPGRNSLLFETQVTNRSLENLERVYAQNCIHFSKAPDFICDDFSRIYIRSKGEWHSLASLDPTSSFPRYYREGFPSRGRIDPTAHYFENITQDARVDHPLMVLVSGDGARSVGIASEDYEFLFHNQMEYLRCIHSESGSPPPLPPGETATFRQKVYFVEGGLEDCVAAFEKDITGYPAGDFKFRTQ